LIARRKEVAADSSGFLLKTILPNLAVLRYKAFAPPMMSLGPVTRSMGLSAHLIFKVQEKSLDLRAREPAASSLS